MSCSSQAAGSECSNGSTKLKSDPRISGAVEAVVLPPGVLKNPPINDATHAILAKKRVDSSNASSQQTDLDSGFSSFDNQDGSLASTTKVSGQVCVPSNKGRSSISMTTNDGTREPSSNPAEAERNDMRIQNLGYDMTSLSINGSIQHESTGGCKSVSDPCFIGSPENQDLHQEFREGQYNVSLTSSDARKTSGDESPGTNMLAAVDTVVEQDVLSFDNQRLLDPEAVSHKVYSSNLIAPVSEFTYNLSQHHTLYGGSESNGFVHSSSGSELPNGCAEHSLIDSAALRINDEQSSLRGIHNGTLQGDATNCQKNGIPDAGESSIISNILSLDFEPWNDSLTSPRNLAKVFGATDKQQGSISATNSWKVQSNSQSRFSFARQEESIDEPFDAEPAFGNQLLKNRTIGDDKEFNLHKLGIGNGFPSRSSAEIVNFADSQYATNKSSGMSMFLS